MRVFQLDFVESMPLDVPAVLSMERFTTMQTSRGCPWSCVFCDIPIFNEGKWRAGARSTSWTSSSISKRGYGSVYFVDDHFLLQPKRIQAICQGINDQGSRFNGAVKDGLTPSPSTCFRRWRRRTAARSCSASRVAARRFSTGSRKSRRWRK